MSMIVFQTNVPIFLDRGELSRLRTRAMRSGVWFRALSRIDRVLLELTMKVARSVRSSNLARCILTVASKLESALESKVARFFREFGHAIAYKLCVVAMRWGNKYAVDWMKDLGFARYWAVMKLNGHPC